MEPFPKSVLAQLAAHTRVALAVRVVNLALLVAAAVWLGSAWEWEAGIVVGSLLLSLILVDGQVHMHIAQVERHRKHDEKVYQELMKALPPGGGILFARQQRHAEKFMKSIDDLYAYTATWLNDPRHVFLDQELQRLSEQLFEAAESYSFHLARNVFTHNAASGVKCVPREWLVEDPARFHQVIRELDERAEVLVSAYDALVTRVRRAGPPA